VKRKRIRAWRSTHPSAHHSPPNTVVVLPVMPTRQSSKSPAASEITNRKHCPHLWRQFFHHALKLLVIPNISLTMAIIFRHDLRVALLKDSASHY